MELTEEQEQVLRTMFGFIHYDSLMTDWASVLPEELRQYLPFWVQDDIKGRLSEEAR